MKRHGSIRIRFRKNRRCAPHTPAVRRALKTTQDRYDWLKIRRELESNLVLLQTQQENSPDGILVVDLAGQVISRNQRFLEMWHIPESLREETQEGPMLAHALAQTKDPRLFMERVEYLYVHPTEKSVEEVQLKDGRTFERHSSPMFDPRGKNLGRVWFFRDITERIAAAQELKLFRTQLDHSNDAIMVIDPKTLRIVDGNDRAFTELGCTRDELLAMHLSDFDPCATAIELETRVQRLDKAGHLVFESLHQRKDGSTFPVEVSVTMITAERTYALAVSRDITERQRTEHALEVSEIRFRTLVEDASDPVALLAEDGTILYTSPAAIAMSGFKPEEIVGRNFKEFAGNSDLKQIAVSFASVIQDPAGSARLITRLRCKDGTWRVAEATLRNFLGLPAINGLVLNLRDVTERERHLRALTALSASNAALVRASAEVSLAKQICEILVEVGGYHMVWIGYPRGDVDKLVEPIAWAGSENGYLSTAKITWADSDRGRGPTGSAIRNGTTQIVRDYATNPNTGPFHALATQFGLVSGIAIPLRFKSELVGAITLYSDEFNAFDEPEVRLLERLADDLAFGIGALRGQKQHAEDLRRLERGMEATIHAIAGTLEKRDPYTAGHQQRVARLCSAIATELGLSQEKIRALGLAATIHDLGKIETPAEILSRPRKLTEVEYSLVKTHVQAGYEIVKELDFPWPIAEMVVQHHERLDGSGYPNGLSAEHILLESRILMVADVVEAMSSHRPYRPGWGIDAALDAIVEGCGSKFDAQVVDACIKLFREGRFTF